MKSSFAPWSGIDGANKESRSCTPAFFIFSYIYPTQNTGYFSPCISASNNSNLFHPTGATGRNDLAVIFIYTIRQGFGNRKIGVTNKPRKRIQSIRRTYPRARWAVLLPTPFIALPIERFFHRLLRFFRVTRKGSGKTEWFDLIWPVTWLVDILITIVVALSWYGVWQGLILFAHWYWGK